MRLGRRYCAPLVGIAIALLVAGPSLAAAASEWVPVDVTTARYGAADVDKGEILKAIADAAQKWLNKVNPAGGKLAESLPKVFSINQAVDVWITYACKDSTGKVIATKVVKLDDADAQSWWFPDAKTFNDKRYASDRERIIKKRTPQGGCAAPVAPKTTPKSPAAPAGSQDKND